MIRQKSEKQRLLEEASGACIYCGHPLKLDSMEADHIVPRSAGGENCYSNKICSCPICNAEKADRSVEEFMSLRSRHRNAKYSARIKSLLFQQKLPEEKYRLLKLSGGKTRGSGGDKVKFLLLECHFSAIMSV